MFETFLLHFIEYIFYHGKIIEVFPLKMEKPSLYRLNINTTTDRCILRFMHISKQLKSLERVQGSSYFTELRDPRNSRNLRI